MEVKISSNFAEALSKDILCTFLRDIIDDNPPTSRIATPTGIVIHMRKTAPPPPVVSSLIIRIGKNATHTEIIVIVNRLLLDLVGSLIGVVFLIDDGEDSETREPLCRKQYPDVLNSRALQPSKAHFLSPISITSRYVG